MLTEPDQLQCATRVLYTQSAVEPQEHAVITRHMYDVACDGAGAQAQTAQWNVPGIDGHIVDARENRPGRGDSTSGRVGT